MQNLIIRKANQSDIELLQNIGRQTFFEKFTENNSEENMLKYAAEAYSFEKTASEVNNPNSQFYLATLNNQTVGYLKINFGDAQTELQDPQALELERIYVLKEFQGKKIGQMLFEKTLELAKESKLSYVWLGVWEENSDAIKFYEKNGLKAFGKHIFMLGNDPQTDIMMKIELNC
ncbi:MAG: GNAT family N-acetyltransferase [Bacteroidetes bacterium HGW-Bacteroidetes-3]|jgi:ribosomal protein S18 acetylase RimI-like enzyme|nr:MAG: GNAT family N-acetyltransferase [Bacteroidetes bacterium HGW-Bacteroidetes-3]